MLDRLKTSVLGHGNPLSKKEDTIWRYAIRGGSFLIDSRAKARLIRLILRYPVLGKAFALGPKPDNSCLWLVCAFWFYGECTEQLILPNAYWLHSRFLSYGVVGLLG
jgi:hypothetical protein